MTQQSIDQVFDMFIMQKEWKLYLFGVDYFFVYKYSKYGSYLFTDLILWMHMARIHKQIHTHIYQETISPRHNYNLYLTVPQGRYNVVHL